MSFDDACDGLVVIEVNRTKRGVIEPSNEGEAPSVGTMGRGVVSRPSKTNPLDHISDPLRHMRDPLRHMPTLSAHGKWRRGCSIIRLYKAEDLVELAFVKCLMVQARSRVAESLSAIRFRAPFGQFLQHC